jgi:hypothetical protein
MWSSANGASGYRLDVSTSSSFTTFLPGYHDLDVGNRDIGNTLGRAVVGLTPNTAYYYRVRSYNANGVGPYSNTISVTTGSGVVIPSGGGLSAEFFDGNEWDNYWVRTEAPTGSINYDWVAGAPPGLDTTAFMVTWTGRIQPTTTGAYTFSATSEGRIHVYVDGNLAISNGNDHLTANDYAAPINLTAGVLYKIEVDYGYSDGYGDPIVKLWWAMGGQARQIVPLNQSYLPAPLQQRPVWSGLYDIVVGQPWIPRFTGGDGTGQWQFRVGTSGQWMSAPWTPTSVGSYSFWIIKRGDATYDEMASSQYAVNVHTDPNGDDDGDGVSNGVEQMLGLNPNNPADVFVERYDYDKTGQLKGRPGAQQYFMDDDGNITEVQP